MADRKTKKVSGYVVYNYHSDNLRLLKTKPSKSKLSPKELPFELKLEVEVPKMDIPKISKTIQVPEARVREAVADMAIEPSELESDYPEPKRVLVQNDEELLREQFAEMGLENTAEAEREEMLNWLRELYSTEMTNNHREGVLSLLEETIQEVKQE